MDSETPLLKYIAAAVGIVIVCFCLGYFVLGPKAPPPGRRAPAATPQPQATADAFRVTAAPPPPLSVLETTAQREAARKKAEEAARKKAEEEQLRKAEEDARKAAEVADGGTEITLENVEPTPDPNATPTVAEGSGEGGAPPTVSETTGEAKDPVKSSDLAREGSALFRVRVGASFGTRDGAESLAKELRGRGYSALVIADRPGKFHVQSGAFKDRKGAESLQGELKANGYDAAIQP